ncbi:MAG: copper amine oxidase [Puia sp.]|nr:copper amine oxidase [Puia sp.]
MVCKSAVFFIGLFFLNGLRLQAQQLDRKTQELLTGAKQGEVLSLPAIIPGKIPEIAYRKEVLSGPRLIISDDPEYILEPECLALREIVSPGPVRLYLYNVNGVVRPAKMPRKITAVLKNTGEGIMHLRFLKYSSQPPSSNYYQVGKQGLADYFTSAGSDSILSIPPGEAAPIDPRLERQTASYDELVHGFYEFTIDQPGEIAILQTSPDTEGPVALARLHSVVPPSRSNAGRGLFEVCNYKITPKKPIDTREGPVSLVVADGKKDPWITGREGSTGQAVALSGNYGVVYTMELEWKSTDGRSLALVTWNPWSNNSHWCGGMANTMIVGDGIHKEEIELLPSDRLITGGAPEAILVKVFHPSADKRTQIIKLTFSPPGASCLPIPLVFIPVDTKTTDHPKGTIH